jgi:hypothetical protein
MVAGGLRQIQWIRAGGHYYSQSELLLTFGVGRATTAELSVTWPGGNTQTLTGVETNRVVTVTEAG